MIILKAGDPERIKPIQFIGRCPCCRTIVECDRSDSIHDIEWEQDPSPFHIRGRWTAKVCCPTESCRGTIGLVEISEVSDLSSFEIELQRNINGTLDRRTPANPKTTANS